MNSQDIERKLNDLSKDSALETAERNVVDFEKRLAEAKENRRRREEELMRERHTLERELEKAREEERKKAA